MKTVIASCAIIYRKHGEKAITIPVIIQIEGTEKEKEFLRLSLRCAKNKIAIKAYYELIMLFMGKS